MPATDATKVVKESNIMIARYVFSVVVGTVVTFTLIFVMHLLIEYGESAMSKTRDRHMLEFVRVQRNENLNIEDQTPEKPPGMLKKSAFQDSGSKSWLIDLDLSIGLEVFTGSLCYTFPLFPAMGAAYARIASL